MRMWVNVFSPLEKIIAFWNTHTQVKEPGQGYAGFLYLCYFSAGEFDWTPEALQSDTKNDINELQESVSG